MNIRLAGRTNRQPSLNRNRNGVRAQYLRKFELLMTSLMGASDSSDAQVFGVIGSGEKVGSSTITANLGIAVTRLVDDPILVIDADEESSTLSRRCGAKRGAGLAQCLAGNVEPLECIQPTVFARNLSVLPVGRKVEENGTTSAKIANLYGLIETLRTEFSLILVDLPSASNSFSGIGFARVADGVLLVIAAEDTSVDEAQQAKKLLAEANANVLGVVLNTQRRHFPNWFGRRS